MTILSNCSEVITWTDDGQLIGTFLQLSTGHTQKGSSLLQ